MTTRTPTSPLSQHHPYPSPPSLSSRSSTSSDFSYFHPQAPSSSSSTPSGIPYPHPHHHPHHPHPPYSPSSSSSSSSSSSASSPIITATVTTRNPRTPGPVPPAHLHSHSSGQLQQFALRIPHTPSLSLSALRHPAPEVSPSPPPFVSSASSLSAPGRTPGGAGYDDLPSPMDRSRRSAHSPLMSISSSNSTHTLSVLLPTSIQPEMVTISANKGDKIKVVADAWHMEDDCHYEWQISFPPHDIDMSAVHAKFDPDGRLTIDVRRLQRYTSHH